MSTTVKLGIAALIVVGVTAYMAYVGTSTTWKYYLTVDECLADASVLVNQRMRVSGTVAAGSLEISPDRDRASFKLSGTEGDLWVSCAGPLPDNLAEDVDVVVEGRLDELVRLQGDQVLTRCASKYVPETSSAIARQPGPASEGLRR